MDFKKRYPFLIADENGYVLLASPIGLCGGDNIFYEHSISSEDSSLIMKCIFQGRCDKRVLASDQKSGKAIIINLSLFPSTRTIAAIYTDIDFTAAAQICRAAEPTVLVRQGKTVPLKRKHEKIFSDLSDALFTSDAMFSAALPDAAHFLGSLSDRVHALSYLAGVRTRFSFELQTHTPCDNFDFGTASLFLITVLAAASANSDMRKAEINAVDCCGEIKLCASFSFPSRRIVSNEERLFLDNGFEKALCYLRRLCERLNIPFSYMVSDSVSASVIPFRLEVSEIGLKHPYPKIEE